MTLHAALLVLFSALLHPVRDLILKGHPYPESAYLAVTAAWVAIAFAHTVAAGTPLTLPAGTWQLVVASAACLTAYYFGTMAALKTGDLSIYYPIIRSSPLLIVVLSWMAGGAQYAQPVLAGIVLVVLAGFMLQRQPGRLVASPRTALLAVIAMAGSAGYTIADHAAMAGAPANLATGAVGHAAVLSPQAFLFWVYVLVTPAFAALTLLFKPKERNARTHLTAGWGASPGRLVAASGISYLSYLLILSAFGIGAGAAETAAVRQASIPVSVVLAALVLGETRLLPRLGWASLIAAGIAMILLGG